MNNKKGFIPIMVIIGVMVLLGITGYFVVNPQTFFKEHPEEITPQEITKEKGGESGVCTQDAKQCSDGSYVGRTGPNCEFAKCPAPTPIPAGEKIIMRIGDPRNFIQKINPDSVEVFSCPAYPVATPNCTNLRSLRIGDDIGESCEGVSTKLISIDYTGQIVTFNKIIGKQPYGGCPICLAGNTLIDTPLGSVAVKDLKIGMPIWTIDNAGNRASGTVIKTSKVPVPKTHQMVHLILGDGRELFVSPGHPIIDGRVVGDLVPGDLYDGVSVMDVERIPYDEETTYDVLSSGATGFYWANNILIGSTLR